MGFLGSVTRGLEGVATGGLSEFGQSNPFGVPNAQQYAPMAVGAGVGALAGNPMAGLGIGASLFSATQAAQAQANANATNVALAREGMAFSADQAKKQMDFQERMSNTSVQRMVKDMEQAGINPMLAAGAGESTPSGAMAPAQVPTVAPVPTVVGGMLSTAKDLISTYANVKSSLASADAAKASAAKAGVETDLARKKGPEASVESRIFGWFDKLLQGVSNFSAKQFNATKSDLSSPASESQLKLNWANQ